MAKSEKKAKKASNPEMVKAIISAVTAVLCVVAVVITSISITGKICETNLAIAEKSATSAGSNSGSVSTDDGSSYVDDSVDAVVDDGTVAPDADAPVADDSTAADDGAAATPDASAPAGNNAAASTGAPVGNDIAKIVAYYNAAANNTKAYKGTMKLAILQGTTSKVTETSLPSAAISIVNELLPNDYPTKKTFTVKNGQGEGYNERKQENESKPLADILPIDGNAKMSTLSAAGVKSAKCEKVAGGYKVTLVLKPETIHSLDDKPKHHSSCMDVLDITADDIKPFTAKTMDITYPGATLTATINDKNLLTEFDVNEPVDVVGDVEWTVVKASIVIDASWKQNVKFTY
ncbi:MAG: hypothetical protein IJZ88_07235 [Clostridia bacterium]|nr:hypothetical protein [Clostridia bacterium]